ncbi:hypothetical protein Q3G72_026067 [Acer saccharum]|nr:hypothetical protein Q3G72_026067 [Acer saccharum]
MLAKQCWRLIRSRLALEDFELLVCVLWWRVWQRRNMAIHNNNLLDAAAIYEWVVSYCAEFREANEKISKVREVEKLCPPRWQYPMAVCYYCWFSSANPKTTV